MSKSLTQAPSSAPGASRRTLECSAFVFVLAVFSLVPLAVALQNLIGGSQALLDAESTTANLDNRFRYLSGVYLGMAVLLWSILRSVEEHHRTVIYVTCAVALGGVGRAISFIQVGASGTLSAVFLVAELAAPLLALWHRRLVNGHLPNDQEDPAS